MDFNDILNYIHLNTKVNKDLGQNYLVNDKIAKKMVSLLQINKNDNIFEAGSGYGTISFFLVNHSCKKIALNDIDISATDFLKKMYTMRNIDVIRGSFLKIDINGYNKIISSLPYYITTKAIEYFLIYGVHVTKYVFLVQKEFLKRLNSSINSKDYSPLLIMIKSFFILKEEFNVPSSFFYPCPHVQSIVFTLSKKKEQNSLDRKKYLHFLKKMFINRRKTLYKNLSIYLDNKEIALDILTKNKISIFLRPQQIQYDIYLNIFKEINDIKS